MDQKIRVSGKDSIPLLKDNITLVIKNYFFLFGNFCQNGDFIRGLMKSAVRGPLPYSSFSQLLKACRMSHLYIFFVSSNCALSLFIIKHSHFKIFSAELAVLVFRTWIT